ncbi:MAG: hypothetical protein ACO28T_06730 [Schleiferiaceae bacterium]
MRPIALILIALVAGTGNSWAQSADWSRLVSVARDRSLNDGARLSALDSLTELSLEALRRGESALPENALRTESPDEKFALVTLNAPLNDGGYAYRGLVGRPAGRGEWTWSALSDGQWPEAIVYRIVQTKDRGRTYYVALWYKPHLNDVQEKGIEPVIATRSRRVFGAPVFSVKKFNDEVFKKSPERLVLRYGPTATASVRPEKPGVILIDEVAPVRDAPKGMYRYYGPTAVQNRLVFRDGKWHFETLP